MTDKKKKLRYYDITQALYIGIELDSVKLGQWKIINKDSKIPAIVDSGTSLIILDSNIYQLLQLEQCYSNLGGLNDFCIMIDKDEYCLTPKQYTLYTGDSNCLYFNGISS